jgi:DNA-binding NtrC family response regulator
VILMSGYSERDAVKRFAGKGLAGFIKKPYEAELLVSTLSQILSASERDPS